MIEGQYYTVGGGNIIFRIDRAKSVFAKLSLWGMDLNGAVLSVHVLDEIGGTDVQVFTTSSDNDVVVDINQPGNYLRINTDSGGAALANFSYVER